MKITNLSLAAIAAMTLTTSAMADIDMKIGGQAVVYYETNDGGSSDLFNNDSSQANAGLQLNANADIGNGFGLGFQGTALSTFGLEGNLVDGVKQSSLGNTGDTTTAGDYFTFTKAYITKQVANTTLKLGRQELPKSLSPLAFTEGWNVFKNTFDAIVAINSDIPDTTLVGAYVSRTNGLGHADFSLFRPLIGSSADDLAQNKGAYMLTVANKSMANVPVTVSYYQLPSSDISAVWADVKVNNLTGPVNFGLQGGNIHTDAAVNSNDTAAFGAKVTGKASNVDLSLAYSKVNNGAIGIQNLGTGIKSPLFTQMIYNQNAIARDASTFVLKAAMPVASGKVIAQYGMTDDSNTGGTSASDRDYNELDLIYKTKLSGMDVFGAYVRREVDAPAGVVTALQGGKDNVNIVRVWTRYNF